MTPRFLRFLIVGAVGYAVNQAVLFLLYEPLWQLGLPAAGTHWQTPMFTVRDLRLLIGSAAGVEMAILSNFFWHNRWTFSGQANTGSGQQYASQPKRPFFLQLLRFNVASMGSPAISLLMTNTLTPFFGVHYLIANSLGILLGLLWNWLWASKVIWRRKKAANVAPTA